jgi:serine/threonine protein kinase/WD40 repeat protein
MNRCSECNFPLEPGLLNCPQCGVEVTDIDTSRGTVDATEGENYRANDLSDTVQFAAHPEDRPTPNDQDEATDGIQTVAMDDDENALQEAQGGHATVGDDERAGSGTVSAPGIDGERQVAPGQETVDASGEDPWGDEDELAQTIDAGMTELDEADDFDFDDDFPGVQSDGFEPGNGNMGTESLGTVNAFLGGPAYGTFDLGESADSNTDADATYVPGEELPARDQEMLDEDRDEHATIDMASEDRRTKDDGLNQATIDASGDADGTIERPSSEMNSAATNDDAGTVVLPPSGITPIPGDKTVVYESTDSGNSTVEATGGGTEGRLKRLWEGVAGSSENPMHSLQAVGLQASDSIFQRVATRRVADASTTEDVLADYQIVDKLGEGAMGIVFSARQTAVNRIVAIKTAKPNFQANDDSRRRFLYEAHITADLDHSNIVPIHELGASEEGMLFYSMKLVQGTEWSRVMRKKTREQNLEIFMKVTDAMAFAHSKGVIHRDLKPENTMLGQFGEVFVTDWGTAINLEKDTTFLAKAASKGDKYLTVEDGSNLMRGDSIVLHDGENSYDRVQIVSIDEANHNRLYLRRKLTRDYQPSRKLRIVKSINLAGTPCYMAPEMAGHQLPKIGKRSDIYILGAILYDLVTGKPPHSGDSVTQCLRAALANKVEVVDNDDPLLKIAYKAMSTDPAERFQSVEELQEAVREYRRHAESISLTERSSELLSEAVEKRDYATFSRALFGYRDAIELWPENSAATSGLKKARLAFGEAAYAQGDYDLVLQTLDREVPAEQALLDQAVAAKKKAEGREASLKMLQRVVAAVVLLAVAGLSALAWIANDQRNTAVEKSALAEKNEGLALAAKKDAEAATAEAIEALTKEELAREAESAAKLKAEESEVKTKAALGIAQEERDRANTATIEAVNEKKRAEEQKLLADAAAELAKRRASQILLGEYNSALALAKSQIEAFDLQAATDNLNRLRTLFASTSTNPQVPDSDVFFGNIPKIDSWGWQRIELLGNLDLPKAQIGLRSTLEPNAVDAGVGLIDRAETNIADTSVTSAAYATSVQRAVVGTKEGLIQILQYDDGTLSIPHQWTESGAAIDAVAIAPDGQEVVYSFTRGDVSGVKQWEIGKSDPQEVVATEKRAFQYFAYSPDGRQVVGGISGGVWLWQRDAQWFAQSQPAARISLRGKLTHLQPIDSQHSLLTTQFQDQQILVGILDHQAGSIQLLEMAEPLPAPLRSAAHTLIDNQIAVGLADNSVWIGSWLPGSNEISNLRELPNKHRAPVTGFASNGRDQLITFSGSEPVSHVWKYDAAGNSWDYDTNLTGLPRNIARIGVLSNGEVLGVDLQGTSIVWDVERQKQRRRLERISGLEPSEYVAPVEAVVAGRSGGQALAIDANGVVDLWSLGDGQTKRIDGNRWSYFGHTPGAELVNSAIDTERGVVVTAASLQNASRKYLTAQEHAWEFCIWDMASGEMRKRWSVPQRQVGGGQTESIEQRLSLVDQGRQILLASDNETRLVDLASGQETFSRSDFGSYFAVANPMQPNWLMLVKRSGAVRLLNLRQLSSWDNPANRQFSLADPSDIPLQGVWSQDGERFYLAFSTGGVAVFAWNGSTLELNWSTRSLTREAGDQEIERSLQELNGRVASHLDIDLALSPSSDGETLHIATRKRGASPSTRLVSYHFMSGSSRPTLAQRSLESGVRWLDLHSDHSAQLVNELHDQLLIDDARIRSRVKTSRQTFVSTIGAQVFGLTDGTRRFTSYGRPRLVSATGNQEGTALWALVEDGSIWRFAIDTAAVQAEGVEHASWSRIDVSALGAEQISLAPDGRHLLVINGGEGALIDAQSGEMLQAVGAVSAANWDPSAPARLAICSPEGELAIFSDGQSTPLAEQPQLSVGAKIVGVHFFNERWKDPAQPVRKFLLVHSEWEDQGGLQFLPIDPAPEGAARAMAEVQEIALDSKLVVSPTENIFVTGAPGGTVGVWFAAPTHDSRPHQLFDLEGHRGERLTCIAFSSDGRTVITADTKNRLYAWLSRDPLVNQ